MSDNTNDVRRDSLHRVEGTVPVKRFEFKDNIASLLLNTDGMDPISLLELSQSTVNVEMDHNPDGTVPENRLFCAIKVDRTLKEVIAAGMLLRNPADVIASTCKAFMDDIVDGIEPVRLFCDISNPLSQDIVQIAGGTPPVNELLDKVRLVKNVIVANSDGIVPMNAFACSNNPPSFDIELMPDGNVPSKEFEYKKSDWIFVKLYNPEGSDPTSLLAERSRVLNEVG